jgi:hypothetical protein
LVEQTGNRKAARGPVHWPAKWGAIAAVVSAAVATTFGIVDHLVLRRDSLGGATITNNVTASGANSSNGSSLPDLIDLSEIPRPPLDSLIPLFMDLAGRHFTVDQTLDSDGTSRSSLGCRLSP